MITNINMKWIFSSAILQIFDFEMHYEYGEMDDLHKDDYIFGIPLCFLAPLSKRIFSGKFCHDISRYADLLF